MSLSYQTTQTAKESTIINIVLYFNASHVYWSMYFLEKAVTFVSLCCFSLYLLFLKKRKKYINVTLSFSFCDITHGTRHGCYVLARLKHCCDILAAKRVGRIEIMREYQYTIILHPDAERGGYTVTVPSLPGCITEGDTVEEAIAMAK
jgi:hypothetical protein